MEGIGANKEFVDFCAAVSVGLDKSLANGKWELSDVSNFWDAALAAYQLAGDIGNLPKEWADFSQDEIKVLSNYFNGKLDISNDMLEAAIEASYNIALNVLKFAAIKLGSK